MAGECQALRLCCVLKFSRSGDRHSRATKAGRWERISSPANGPTGRAVSERGTRRLEAEFLGLEAPRGYVGEPKGRVRLSGAHWVEMRPRPPYLRVSTPLPVLHPRAASAAATDLLSQAPPRDRGRTLPRISSAHNSSFSFTWGGMGTWEVKTLAILCNTPTPPTSCPSARLKRGDRAGHQTGKKRRWAVAGPRSWRTPPHNHRGRK